MKQKLIFSLAVILLMVACKNTSRTDAAAVEARLKAYQDSIRLAADTAGLAQFRAWKAENELADYNENDQESQNAFAPAPNRNYTTAKTTKRSSGTTRSRSSGSSGTRSSESGNTAKTAEKKGWSKAAKGAVIGGAGGAAAGAVINKRNRAVGAVVGGVLGAGVGYGVGRSKDKKDGRY
jgi:hypothetical protein